MPFGLNAASIINGFNTITSTIASGVNLVNNTVNTVKYIGNTAKYIGNTVGNLFTGKSSGVNAIATRGGGVGYISQGLSPTQWINDYISKAHSENGILRFMYQNLFHDLQPDISGYVLLFMSPPVLSGYLNLGNQNYDPTGTSFLTATTKLFPLLATNFTPPTIQLNSGTLAGSSGTQHYAQELSITDNMSVTYIDTFSLDVYQLHKSWLQYIFQITEGTLEPSNDYLLGGRIDYCASFYFVKFMQNLSSIQYIGKAVKKISNSL